MRRSPVLGVVISALPIETGFKDGAESMSSILTFASSISGLIDFASSARNGSFTAIATPMNTPIIAVELPTLANVAFKPVCGWAL